MIGDGLGRLEFRQFAGKRQCLWLAKGVAARYWRERLGLVPSVDRAHIETVTPIYLYKVFIKHNNVFIRLGIRPK